MLFISNYWPLLLNILAVSQVPEHRHCLKRNKYTSLDLNWSFLIRYGVVTFWEAKTAEEEVILVQNALPKSTQYKNKWAYGIFEEWQRQRLVKVPIVKVVGLFKNYDFHQVESLETPLVETSALSVNYWLTKFVQEVAKPSKERYPPRTLYGIVAGIRRFLAEKKPGEDINPLSTSDKKYALKISIKARA